MLSKAGLVLGMVKEDKNVKKVVRALRVNDQIHSSSSSQTILGVNKALLDVRTAYSDADIYFNSIFPRTGQKQAIVSSNKRIREVNEYPEGLAKIDERMHYMNHTAHCDMLTSAKPQLANCTNKRP